MQYPPIGKTGMSASIIGLGSEHLDNKPYPAMFDNGIVAYAQDRKRQGVVRAIGVSAHNPDTARRIAESGVIELLMFGINPAFDLIAGASDITKMLDADYAGMVQSFDPARAELHRLCDSEGIGITVMKTLGAGKLLSPEHSPFARPMTPAQCIHYALNRPAVVSTLIGCQSSQQILEAVEYLTLPEEEKDHASINKRRKARLPGQLRLL